MAYNKIKLYKTLDSRDFDILEKGVGVVSLPHFVSNFSKKMFLILSSISCLTAFIGQYVYTGNTGIYHTVYIINSVSRQIFEVFRTKITSPRTLHRLH